MTEQMKYIDVSKSTLNPTSSPFFPGGSAEILSMADQANGGQSVAPETTKIHPNPVGQNKLPSDSFIPSPSQDFDDLKSPISQVHECAKKRNIQVTFSVEEETGPPHMRIFTTKCVIGSFETRGEGNGKKVKLPEYKIPCDKQ